MNRNEIMYELKLIYEERELQATMRKKAWENELYSEHEELASLQQVLQDLRYDYLINQTHLDLDTEKIATLEAKIQQTEHQRKQVLRTILADKPEPEFSSCKTCQDEARIDDQAICPDCYAKTFRAVLEEYLPALLPEKNARFENFDLELFSREISTFEGAKYTAYDLMKRYKTLLQNFIEAYPDKQDNYMFMGKTGTGKSFLAQCMVNALLDRGFFAFYMPALYWEELIGRFRILQKSFSVDEEALARAQDTIELILTADFLVLDDFGLSSGSLADAVSEMHYLLQQRKLTGKSTVFTTNLNLKDIKLRYDERLESRMIEMFNILPFMGDDLRVSMRLAR